MNETITRAAGATHGQEKRPQALENIIQRAGRSSRQRTTLYQDAPSTRTVDSYNAINLVEIVNSKVVKQSRQKADRSPLVKMQIDKHAAQQETQMTVK
jgi:FO synthase